jgi:hypothetical protein
MNVQVLPTGRIFVEYGAKVEYQSPLLIDENFPSIVTYKCAVSMEHVGKVYKTADGRWWLSTIFFSHGTPIEVFSKIEGFFLLNNLHKQKHEH